MESVERSTEVTDRYGRSASWEGEAERSGYGWEFEGQGRNRWGEEVKVEGYGARGYYGSGVVADVEGGRYGDRTVVAGHNYYTGATWATSLPHGARPYPYHGRHYYYHAGVYYRPYSYYGVVHYCYIPPPYYVYYESPPVGAIVLVIAGAKMLYSDGSYYQETYVNGTTQYQIVPAPAGATVPGTALPAERAAITIGSTTTTCTATLSTSGWPPAAKNRSSRSASLRE